MKPLSYLAALFLLFVVFSCQDIFTFSPLDILQRDPATLSKDQQLLYAQQALSSGDRTVMTDALDVVMTSLVPDDPFNPDLHLLAADLMWRLSYVPEALQSYLFANSQQFPDPLAPAAFITYIDNYLTSVGADTTYIVNAAYKYRDDAEGNGATLNAVQDLATGIGFFLAVPPDADATTYLQNGINGLVP